MITAEMWFKPPQQLILLPTEVHLWRMVLEQSTAFYQQMYCLLAEDETMRAKRFYFERDRRHFAVGRGILRTILARYLQVDPREIQFRYGAKEKPALIAPTAGRDLYFNLSHSHGQALYAFTWGRELGVDLEQVRPLSDGETIARHYFSEQEYATLLALPLEQRDEGFFNCWTRKEAYIKALGEGLSHPLDTFDVTLTPGQPAQLLAVRGDTTETTRWLLRSFTPCSGYVAALCVEGHNWQLRCWEGDGLV